MKIALLVLLLLPAGCREDAGGYALIGDAARGHALVDHYGCAACHAIRGGSAQGMVGPPLDRMASRAYIAGHFPNIPQNMVLWLRNPPAMKPRTSMPNTGVTERDARDIAAFLYTLK